MDYLQYTVKNGESRDKTLLGFKPYYKWITFNTLVEAQKLMRDEEVLNLIINGLPSIRYRYSKRSIYC